jgi:hypothetical protein
MRARGRHQHGALFRPEAEPFPIPQRRGFNFLSVFEWIERKGADVLLRAYLSGIQAGAKTSRSC